MNRIDNLFEKKKHNVLSVFVTAGFPKYESTCEVIEHLEKAGADLIEIGIPFSDPIADGPVIQQSSNMALANGMTLKKLLQELKKVKRDRQMPILLMGYLNSVVQYGIEPFYEACNEVGIDGLILPDLSINDYVLNHKKLAEHYNIHVVFLISPDTDLKRIKLIDQHSKGFIYLVSSNSTTGTNKGVSNSLEERVNEIKSLKLSNPILMGFGIKGNKEFTKACSLVNGAVVGSSFVSMLKNSSDIKADIRDFVLTIKNPLKEFQS